MRAFFCIPIEPGIRSRISRIATQLRDTTDMRASWVSYDNYHITVRFLGEIEPEWIPDIDAAAQAACASLAIAEGIADRIGAFPKVENARVLWAGGDAPDDLRRLITELDRRLEALGFPKQRVDRRFHVTLARIKGRPDVLLPRAIETLGAFAPLRIPIDRLVLMESTLTSRGAEYTPLFTVPVGGDSVAPV